MKVYDKEIYNRQESLKTTTIIIVVFLIGFIAGYMASSFKAPQGNNVENTVIHSKE